MAFEPEQDRIPLRPGHESISQKKERGSTELDTIGIMVLMAKKTIVTEEFTDDIDGSVAVGTVPFAYDGTNYEIDLSKKNKSALDKALKPYLDAARKVKATRGPRGRASNGRAGKRGDLADIRAWARANGHAVSDRGRIPASVIEAFDSSK